MKLDDLKTQLEIDKAALDKEIAQQPMLFFDIAEQCENAIAVRDSAKEHLASVDADLDGMYREQMKAVKFTEAVIANKVQLDPHHKKAFDQWLEAKTDASKLIALMEAFKSRGHMLRDLASLYTTGYYETTSVQGTHFADEAVYKERRHRLAEARAKKQA